MLPAAGVCGWASDGNCRRAEFGFHDFFPYIKGIIEVCAASLYAIRIYCRPFLFRVNPERLIARGIFVAGYEETKEAIVLRFSY